MKTYFVKRAASGLTLLSLTMSLGCFVSSHEDSNHAEIKQKTENIIKADQAVAKDDRDNVEPARKASDNGKLNDSVFSLLSEIAPVYVADQPMFPPTSPGTPIRVRGGAMTFRAFDVLVPISNGFWIPRKINSITLRDPDDMPITLLAVNHVGPWSLQLATRDYDGTTDPSIGITVTSMTLNSVNGTAFTLVDPTRSNFYFTSLDETRSPHGKRFKRTDTTPGQDVDAAEHLGQVILTLNGVVQGAVPCTYGECIVDFQH